MSGRSRLRGALLGVLACSSLSAGAHAEANAPNAPPATSAPGAGDRVAQRARELFDEGVRLANEGRFESARAVFRSAYDLQPHPSVLYNIAQCEVRLGDAPSAIATLERFLATAGREIGDEQRQAVQKQLDELRGALPVEAGGAPATAATAARTVDAPGLPSDAPEAAELAPAAPSPAPYAVPVAEPLTSEAASDGGEQRSLRPLVLGGTGLALLGAATGLYLWNDARHDDWTTEHAALAATPALREQLARDPALWQRAKASNQRLSSIHTVDAITVLCASAGALAIGAGVWDWLASEGSDRPLGSSPLRLQVGASPRLEWQGRW
jgi:hypothetical protein